ncbi:MAG: hypothetical protein FJZ92_09180 [Chloroflexi bacterium]|nr:hypothetical protein [Chloroflexota bacterium]
MPDVERLLAAFASGALVRPSAAEANLLDLASAIFATTGVPGAGVAGHAAELASELAGAEHVVLVLADGLGRHFVDGLPADAWMRRHLRRSLQVPFPPTTAVALTSLATGRWLTDHAAPGWWTYLPGRDVVAVPLRFHRLSDERSLEDLGVPVEEVFPQPSLVPRMRAEVEFVLPRAIAESVYSRYIGGGSARAGYDSLRGAAEHVVARLAAAGGPTYTYWYTPRVDTLAHELGVEDEQTVAAVRELDGELAALAEQLAALPRQARLVVTADHGHRDVPDDGREMIAEEDSLLEFLRCHPSGDVRAVYFHLRVDADAAQHREFRAVFHERFGARWVLLSTDEVEALRLLGPGPLSTETRSRIGDYTAIALGAEVMRYEGAPGADRFMRQRSQHSGLSPAEMTVPLIIA